MIMDFIILTAEQNTEAMTLNDSRAAVEGRLVDNPDAGEIVGQYALPARLLDNSDYQRWVPSLGGLPIAVYDSETLFLPPAEEV